MDRLTVSSALPAEYAERVSDVWESPSPAEQMRQQNEIDEKADDLVRSEAWWDGVLCGINGATNMLPAALARIMSNLDKACSGDSIGRDAITAALSQVQREATAMARAEVERDEDY